MAALLPAAVVLLVELEQTPGSIAD